MKFVDVEINNQLFDFTLDETHPLIVNAFTYMDDLELRNVLIRAMEMGGLTYDNIDEMNEGGTWCIAYKAESVTA